MNASNPFSRPSPFRPSSQMPTSSSSSSPLSAYSPHSYSSPYANIIQSQVRPITTADRPSMLPPYGSSQSRPSISRTSSLNAGLYSYSNDTGIGFSASRGYEPSSNYTSHSSSHSSFDIGAQISASKSNPFTRPSLLSNNYTPLESYRPSPSTSYDSVGLSNGYDHLKYTPSSSSTPISTPALGSGVDYSNYNNGGHSPNKYARNNYNTNTEDDTASVRSYINKITDLEEKTGSADNPFTRRSITSVSPTHTRPGIHSSTDVGTRDEQGPRDYSHLQYQPASTKSSNPMPDRSGGLDKYKFQYEQQTKRGPQTNIYSNSYNSYNNIKPAVDIQNQEESPLINPYKYSSLEVDNKHVAISKPRGSSKDKYSNLAMQTGHRKYQFEDYHENEYEKENEKEGDDDKQFDFNRRSQYQYQLQRMEQMLKPTTQQYNYDYDYDRDYKQEPTSKRQQKRDYDTEYNEAAPNKFDTNYARKPDQLKYTAGFNNLHNNNNNNNNNNKEDDINEQYSSPQFGLAQGKPNRHYDNIQDRQPITRASKLNQIVRFDDEDEQEQHEEVQKYRNPPSFMRGSDPSSLLRGQDPPTKQSVTRGHPSTINYRGDMFYQVQLA